MTASSYRLYPKAIEDLELIYTYSASEFGHAKAESYILDIKNCFDNLSKTPDIARKCDFIHPKLLSYNINSHIIFFKKNISEIVVIRVLHKSMNIEKHL